ncbi:MAG TPA: alpha/beta fold hydrolase [Thermoanaerobaculia bacterium]|nr:alpha/beta fold hydrolase [Thermoanaerobaculia bacterium]
MRRLTLSLLLALALAAVLLARCATVRPYSEVRRGLPAERLLPIDGRLVYVEQQGTGEPVVLVHGFGASSYSWRKVIPGLAAAHRVVALDLNGFGYTERPKDPGSYTREGQARLVLAVMDALGIARADLVGHSYGGAISLFLASRHPERVRSLVLVDSAAPSYPEDRRSGSARFRPLNTLYLRFALRPWFVRRSYEKSVYDPALATPEVVAAYLDRLRIEGEEDAYYGLTAPRSPTDTTADVDLTKIATPTLVLWGAEDRLVAVETGRKISARLPHSRFVVFEKTGHMPMEERPDDFLRLVGEFLAAGPK